MKDCHKFPTFGVYESNLWELPGAKSAPTNQHQTPGCLRFAVRTGGLFFFQMQIGRVEEEKLQRKIKCLKTPWKKLYLYGWEDLVNVW